MKTGVSSVIEMSPWRRRREWRKRKAQAGDQVRAVGVTKTIRAELCRVEGCFSVVPCEVHR